MRARVATVLRAEGLTRKSEGPELLRCSPTKAYARNRSFVEVRAEGQTLAMKGDAYPPITRVEFEGRRGGQEGNGRRKGKDSIIGSRQLSQPSFDASTVRLAPPDHLEDNIAKGLAILCHGVFDRDRDIIIYRPPDQSIGFHVF